MNPKDSRIAWYIKQLTKLSLNPRIKIIGYDKDEFLDIINLLFGPIVDEKGNPLFPEDFRYLACALYQLEQISSMEEYLQRRSVPQEAIEGAKNLAEIKPKEKEALAQAKTKVGRFIQEQEELARQANQLSASQLAQAEKNITQEVERTIRERAPQLVRNQPEVVDKLVEEFKEEVLTNCFESPRQALDPEAYQAIIDQALPRIDLVIAEENIPLSPGEKEALKLGLKETAKTTLPEASVLTQIDFKLPQSVQEKIPVQGTAFSPVAAAFHPVDLVRKLSQPSAIACQMVVAGEISDEEAIKQQLVKELRSPKRDVQRIAQLVNTLREMKVYKLSSRELRYSVYGLSSQDFQKSIDFLQKELGAGHPNVLFLIIQKDRQERFEAKFPSASKRNWFSSVINRQMGQRPQVVELRGTYTSLPSPESVGKMNQVLNQIGTVSRFYQISSQFPGIRQIESLPIQKIADFRGFIFRKTLQPVFARLGKTAVGKSISAGAKYIFKEGTKKAIKEGLKKVGTWLGTRAGLHGIIQAIGAGTTWLTAGASLLISAAISLLIEAGSWILRKIKKPENALALVGGSVLIFVLLPMPLALAGLFPAAIGGFGLMAGAGGILGGFATGVEAFFVALAAPFVTSAIAYLVIGIMGGLAIITFFIVMLTASAFIIPAKPLEEVSAYFKVNKTVSRTEISNNDELQNNPKVTYRISVTAQQPITITGVRDERTVSCKNPPGPNVQTPIDIDHPSDKIKSWASDPYELSFDSSFKDCRVCNTVTVIANIEGVASGEMATDTQCIKIGNPPEDCPSGWPTDHGGGGIGQGPNTPCNLQGWCCSHCDDESIDISVVMGTPVKATHRGIVVEATWGTGVVKVQGTCEGKQFTSVYRHLSSKTVKPGDSVSPGDIIGASGIGGTGAHLHYEFDGLNMVAPYIPKSASQGCCGVCGTCHNEPCGVNW